MTSPQSGALFPVAQRDAFLIPSQPGIEEDEYHLFTVLTDPTRSDSVLLVNASTVYPSVVHDTTCYLNVGDHPFIRHLSYIFYAKSRIVTLQKMRTLVASRTIIYRPPPISVPVFERIIAGVGGPQMDPEHRVFYNTFR